MNLGRVLKLIGDHLDGQGRACALVGGLGLAAHGLVRATLDLALVVPAAAQASLIELMEDLGYETLHRSAGYSNHLHPEESMGRVDFVYVRGPTRGTRGMSSSSPGLLDTLARDLLTSPADVEALRRAAAMRPPDFFKAIQALIDALPPAARRRRRGTAAGRPEFVL